VSSPSIIRNFFLIISEPEFVNFNGAQESIPPAYITWRNSLESIPEPKFINFERAQESIPWNRLLGSTFTNLDSVFLSGETTQSVLLAAWLPGGGGRGGGGDNRMVA
jgi:hypothetical protein